MLPYISAFAVVIAVVLLLVSCSFYHHPYPDHEANHPDYELRTVQLDDFGSFWDASKAQDALSAVETQSLSMTSSTYVVLFIHGWHHNADLHDQNLRQFNTWLANLSSDLSQPERCAARKDSTGSTAFKLIGIYVAWRGRALPGVLDYATMWWRKSAAERVGDGDISEFLERLQRIYLRANAYNRYRKNPGNTPFTGLFAVGHSFGGQVLLRAVARPLESALTRRAPHMTDAVTPITIPPNPTQEVVAIDSLGDLNVLVNPATEAYQFARIDGLYRQLAYSYQQTPQLVVFSADNDVPRKFFFPIARALTSPFRASFRSSYQGALWGKALGEFTVQQTHELRLSKGAPDSLVDDDFKPEGRYKIERYDFTSETVLSSVKLSRLPNTPEIANSPVLVIDTDKTIIDGHNGVFDHNFLAFLPKYIALIEGKRLVLRFRQFEERKQLERVAAAGVP
jgi:pimeloyl-ACP methyl ester carboxylesterase